MKEPSVAHVAVAVPLHRLFDYRIDLSAKANLPVIGGRVLVPFGPHKKIGIVIGLSNQSDFPIAKLKPLYQVIDTTPLWPSPLFKLLKWASAYYQYPLGDTFDSVLPLGLKKGKACQPSPEKIAQLTELGLEQVNTNLSRSPKQAELIKLLAKSPCPYSELIKQQISPSALKALIDKKWLTYSEEQVKRQPWEQRVKIIQEKPTLNQEQALAVASINATDGFAAFLLDGVTGSGKTEVYLNAIEKVLKKGRQALILVPEIGLTPQTINRFTRRFNVPISVLHSRLNDTERLNAWRASKNNQTAIIIGTRSALFSPCPKLGLIIVDEEHDISYKQQDSFRYHARDLAVMRAYEENIPVILGSATPSLESIHNLNTGKYRGLILSKRAGGALKAKQGILDIRGLYHKAGLSAPLIAQMRTHLSAGNQVMLFLNRRGYAPAVICHECGWLCECSRCNKYFTLHQQSGELRCHHCGSQKPVPLQCQSCGSTQLVSLGVGTEQLENQLNTLFPQYNTVRIDRDSTRKKGEFERFLGDIYENKYQILIGTQMLAKGHHFPNVTLVALIDVDSALFSNDFRAPERLAQLFIQVAGRAGRASKPGTVLIQTHHPSHPLLLSLVHQSYADFANNALIEREETELPPFTFFALFRAQAHASENAEAFLLQIKDILSANPHMDASTHVFGPNPAPMIKRAGQFRWQLIFQAPARPYLQRILTISLPFIHQLPLAKKVKWSLDIEPQDMN